jgi:hypothetical protein
MFNLAVDRIVQDKAYPALATWSAEPYTAEWRQFVQHWPHTVPIELLEHCRTHGFPCELYAVDAAPADAYYPVGIGFFNFAIDYFGLMSSTAIDRLRAKTLRVLFYYHEGDNPYTIKRRLDNLCAAWQLDTDCYRFVSGNTAADDIPGFIYFSDHELLYWYRNQQVAPVAVHSNTRDKDFTVLSRTHKWWRATVMTDLWRTGLLANSYWSYNTKIDLGEDPTIDNPIEVCALDIAQDIEQFLSGGPYRCDTLSVSEHNNHGVVEPNHYANSYCNIVVETHFDADGSGGTFLTEKTFKAIKHGQPFVIIGPPGSLATLRALGYRTFDHSIDNSYDLETDNTRRWLMLRDTIKQIKQHDLATWFADCIQDVQHNQNLFAASKYDRLNNLLERLR